MEAAAENIIQKKLGTAKSSRSPIPNIEELGDMFARHVEAALTPVVKSSTSALVMECEVTKLAPVLEGIPAPAMLGVVGVEGAENMALINISSDLVFHIVDLRMGGNENHNPMPTARSFTGIDVVLCVDVFNTLVRSFEEAIAEILDADVDAKMQLVDFKQNVSMVRIAPENAEVLQITVSLDIGPAARNGDIDVIFPLSVLDVVRAAIEQSPAADAARGSPNDIWKSHMRSAASKALVPVSTLLDRQMMSVTQLEALKPGDLLELPSTAQSKAEVVIFAGTGMETHFAVGHVGAYEGKKVVKITSEPNDAFVNYVTTSLS